MPAASISVAPSPRHGDDLAVLDLEHAPRLGEEGRDRRGEERLAVAEPDHQRALLARRHQRVGVVAVHGGERVVAPELAECVADRVGEVAVVVALDQVGDDLGVGLGAEPVALGLELASQLGVVLDDPVGDDLDLVVAVAMRMRVLLGDPPVGGPAGVREPDRGRGRAAADDPSPLAPAPSRPTAARRLARLPTARTESIRPSSSSEIPAES